MMLLIVRYKSFPYFGISLIALKNCYFAVTSSSTSDILLAVKQSNSISSSVVSSWLCSSTSSSILSSCYRPPVLWSKPKTQSRWYWLHRYLLKVTFDYALRSKLLPNRSKGSLQRCRSNISKTLWEWDISPFSHLKTTFEGCFSVELLKVRNNLLIHNWSNEIMLTGKNWILMNLNSSRRSSYMPEGWAGALSVTSKFISNKSFFTEGPNTWLIQSVKMSHVTQVLWLDLKLIFSLFFWTSHFLETRAVSLSS